MNDSFSITIDGQPVEVQPGDSVLAAARRLGLDIPTLCYLEKCGPLNTCQVCLVKLNGKLVPSCGTKVAPGMAIESETEEVHEARRTALELLFSDHVGDCLSPCHRLCPLQLNIPAMLRHIHTERLDEAIATVRQTLPLAGVLGRLCHHPCEQGCRRGNWDSPAAIRDMERFVTDEEFKRNEPQTPPRKPATGKSVVIIGAGPAGLAAAFYLTREGHRVVLADRRQAAGGTLCDVTETQLPAKVLAAEISTLERLGVEFKPGVELGNQIRLEGLARAFDAIFLAVGEVTKDEVVSLGLPAAGNSIKTDPNTCQTALAKVFAAGSAVRPQKQLVKAMAEGRAAAECVHRFVSGQPARRPEKPFSSIMGRLEPGELRQFLRSASATGSVSPCDRCAGHTRQEAALESSRCLHCDCRSSGNCVLQHYAQVYGADANRFRSERREFDQQLQPGGIIFEPGKCILCGICVKLTEPAAEPLGLTFIGRGFDVRVSAPFNAAIEAGLKNVGAECVKHCPTGALTFAEQKSRPTG
ncbi:MAG TPA: FAD-dependent oxidoreductase [Verrucomicrobiota bacterium]|nr:FAD-dependent oxidoreductase [Verrucomicrobiota bacterium]